MHSGPLVKYVGEKNYISKHKIFGDNCLSVTVLKIKQNITFKLTLFVKNLTKYFKLTLIVISTPNNKRGSRSQEYGTK